MTEPKCSGSKLCSKCGGPKHVLAFAANRSSPDGISNVCRDCRNSRARDNRPRKYASRGDALRAYEAKQKHWYGINVSSDERDPTKG